MYSIGNQYTADGNESANIGEQFAKVVSML